MRDSIVHLLQNKIVGVQVEKLSQESIVIREKPEVEKVFVVPLLYGIMEAKQDQEDEITPNLVICMSIEKRIDIGIVDDFSKVINY